MNGRLARVTALIVGTGGSLGSCPPGEPEADAAGEIALVEAAERVVRFLQGERSFDEIRTADTVTLRISPEGGGARASLPRQSLADPAAWAIPRGPGEVQSLIPPPALTQLTTKPGVHFNCMEYPLASRAPDLGTLPHVGVRLATIGATSCMQTWNLSLVFEAGEGPPVLMAAVYDQWEW